MAKEPLKIDFEDEVEIAGETYTQITMRPPKGKDLRNISHIPHAIDRDLTLVSNLCGLNATPEDFDEADAKVVLDLQKALKSFL